MSAVFGVLGESTVATATTTTVYTVGAGKRAKIKLMFYGVAQANSTISVSINGCPIFTSAALTATHGVGTTTSVMLTAQAAASWDGTSATKAVGLGPNEFYLNEGDTVTYTIGTLAFSSMNFQVVGVEQTI